MNKNKHAILDLNGVVQKSATGQVVKFGLSEIIHFRLSPVVFVNILLKVTGKNKKPFTEKEINLTKIFYETRQHIKIPFLSGAKQAVMKLKEKYNVNILSANKYSDKIDNDYRNFLTNELGEFEDISFVESVSSKKSYYQKMKLKYPNDEIIVIDDSKRHIDDAKAVGLKTLWINKKYGYESLAHAIKTL